MKLTLSLRVTEVIDQYHIVPELGFELRKLDARTNFIVSLYCYF